jgi:hypothetical protein
MLILWCPYILVCRQDDYASDARSQLWLECLSVYVQLLNTHFYGAQVEWWVRVSRCREKADVTRSYKVLNIGDGQLRRKAEETFAYSSIFYKEQRATYVARRSAVFLSVLKNRVFPLVYRILFLFHMGWSARGRK